MKSSKESGTRKLDSPRKQVISHDASGMLLFSNALLRLNAPDNPPLCCVISPSNPLRLERTMERTNLNFMERISLCLHQK